VDFRKSWNCRQTRCCPVLSSVNRIEFVLKPSVPVVLSNTTEQGNSGCRSAGSVRVVSTNAGEEAPGDAGLSLLNAYIFSSRLRHLSRRFTGCGPSGAARHGRPSGRGAFDLWFRRLGGCQNGPSERCRDGVLLLGGWGASVVWLLFRDFQTPSHPSASDVALNSITQFAFLASGLLSAAAPPAVPRTH
jgi:hypothetical protein